MHEIVFLSRRKRRGGGGSIPGWGSLLSSGGRHLRWRCCGITGCGVRHGSSCHSGVGSSLGHSNWEVVDYVIIGMHQSSGVIHLHWDVNQGNV